MTCGSVPMQAHNKPMISVVIQAGGRSSRMGTDKALVELGGQTMIEHVISRVQHLGEEVLVTTNRPKSYAFLNLPMASDEVPGAGALPGLRTALRAARGVFVVLVACDIPFVSPALLRLLIERVQEADVAVPVWEDRFQPLCAVYRRETVLQAVEDALAAGKKRMISFFEDVRVVEVNSAEIAHHDPDGLTFFNINTPEELQIARERVAADSAR